MARSSTNRSPQAKGLGPSMHSHSHIPKSHGPPPLPPDDTTSRFDHLTPAQRREIFGLMSRVRINIQILEQARNELEVAFLQLHQLTSLNSFKRLHRVMRTSQRPVIPHITLTEP